MKVLETPTTRFISSVTDVTNPKIFVPSGNTKVTSKNRVSLHWNACFCKLGANEGSTFVPSYLRNIFECSEYWG